MRLSLDTILSVTGGTLIAPSTAGYNSYVDGVSIDSRAITANSLFICISGNITDGHNFVLQAVKEGASAILASHNPFEGAVPVPVILVTDTLSGLKVLAQVARKMTKAKVIGITGTAGKTTVKELVAQLLTSKGKVAKNYLNFNTQIGMSFSILAAQGDEDFWVMEVGISNPQDMEELGTILTPDITLIINVGPGHLSGLNKQGVAYHKAQLLRYMKDEGLGIVSLDYPDLTKEVKKIRSDSLFFSVLDNQCRYYGKYTGVVENGYGTYRLWLDNDIVDVTSPFLGNFGMESVLASTTIAHKLGVSSDFIKQQLFQAILPQNRFSCFTHGNWLCIDDSYNANPLSMNAVIESTYTLSDKKKPLVYVLGEMLELGDSSEAEHEKIGKKLAQTGASIIFWKGGMIDNVLIGLKKGGFKGILEKISTEQEFQSLFLEHKLDEGIIVFKGSRSNKMEVFVDAFMKLVGTK